MMLPETARGLLLLCFLLLMCAFFYLFSWLVRLWEKRGWLLVFGVFFGFEWLLFRQMLHPWEGPFPRENAAEQVFLLLAIAALAALDGVLSVRVRKKTRDTVTPMSVKEAVDRLPTGVCLYYSGGLCRLVNSRMTEISVELTGKAVLNGEDFWETIVRESAPVSRDGYGRDGLLLPLASGAVYSVHRHELQFQDGMLFELTAAEVTDEYRLSLELETAQEHAHEVNERLRTLGERIADLTREREILDSKVRLHDAWGQALLMLRRCILNPDETLPEEALSIFRRNLAVLDSESMAAEAANEERLEDILEAAGALDITIALEGELPKDAGAAAILNHALVVCSSNLAQHTESRLLSVRGEKLPEGWQVVITNDGAPPLGEIRETGGLLNLRRQVERAGGCMQIEHAPQFVLSIEMPDR